MTWIGRLKQKVVIFILDGIHAILIVLLSHWVLDPANLAFPVTVHSAFMSGINYRGSPTIVYKAHAGHHGPFFREGVGLENGVRIDGFHEQPLLIQPIVLQFPLFLQPFLMSLPFLSIIHSIEILVVHFKGCYRYSIVDLCLRCTEYPVPSLICVADTITVFRARADSLVILVELSGILILANSLHLSLFCLYLSQRFSQTSDFGFLLIQLSLLVFQLHLLYFHLGLQLIALLLLVVKQPFLRS